MRRPREIGRGESCYHVLNRVIDGKCIFDRGEKERMRKLMRAVELFTGVQVLTFTILRDHFEFVLRVPISASVSDEELVERLGYLYSPRDVARVERRLRRWRSEGRDDLADEEKKRYTVRMYDLSEFMKTLKQRFTQSFNLRHERKGTLWESRFKSVLIKREHAPIWRIAVLVDQDAVRSGIVTDPAHYTYCGYAEACAGDDMAMAGISQIMGGLGESGDGALLAYRRKLMA